MIGLFRCQAYLPKSFIVGKGCSQQPICISIIHGGHTGLRRHDDFNFDFICQIKSHTLDFPAKSVIVDSKLVY
jgi:hypothetical protein